MKVMHASRSIESTRPLTNDERRAVWAARYYASGMHRTPAKPRIRIPPVQPSARSPESPPGDYTEPRAAAVMASGTDPFKRESDRYNETLEVLEEMRSDNNEDNSP